MKKFIFSFVAMFMLTIATVFGQNPATSNYAGSSKFTDNWSVSLNGGVITPTTSDCFGHVSPVIGIGADKFVTPWLGFGIDAKTAIAAPSGSANPHTAFDAVNINGLIKINLNNLIKFDGKRDFLEVVPVVGLGWGHSTNSEIENMYWSVERYVTYNTEKGKYVRSTEEVPHRNYVTFVAGTELNFNLGKSRAWAINLTPVVKWGGINDFHLDNRNGHFELTAGVTYHFKTSNGTHSYAKAHLYDADEIARLNARIHYLESRKPRVITKTETKIVASNLPDNTFAVTFAQNSAQLSNDAKAILDKVPTNAKVTVVGATSPEGTYDRNKELSVARAESVANYLRGRGVTVISATGNEDGRVAVVTVK